MKESQKKYEEKNLIQFKFALNRKTDADIIEYLKSTPNFRRYLISLIRNDIKLLKEDDY